MRWFRNLGSVVSLGNETMREGKYEKERGIGWDNAEGYRRDSVISELVLT